VYLTIVLPLPLIEEAKVGAFCKQAQGQPHQIAATIVV